MCRASLAGQPLYPGGKGLVTRLYTTCSGSYVTMVTYYVLLFNFCVIIDIAQMPVVVVVNCISALAQLWYAYYTTTLHVQI